MKDRILALLLTFAAITAPLQITRAQTTAEKPEIVAAEVKKVDKEAGKVTLKHAEIKSLDMPAMTMVFRVKNEKLLEDLREGARVNVVIEKALMGYTVTQVELTK